ncbi:hypothetical protein BWQ96_05134 [Gracilariopsis chorda]|uniref:Uncharacterized protein n=1 Tax=Gracilariopsis chorda TaxID=448386 RepID=A0A2V3ISJ2_9FLOR|nr:hypothetical protein BWQ96_05134 [Gracilariopsis chorda]|eukprot:PXF45095.1 hypothetical protein BWQ96_05134 [Gracilariopsis chorda]
MSTLFRAIILLAAVLSCALVRTCAQTFPTADKNSRKPTPLFSEQKIIELLISLHEGETYPNLTFTTPPTSNIRGCADDSCTSHKDCEPRRQTRSQTRLWCDFDKCVRNPRSRKHHNCTSSLDCEEGEFCNWKPIYGLRSGLCISSYANRNRKLFILDKPLTQEPSYSGGLTGDLCILHKDCRGSRSCRGLSKRNETVTGCEVASSACVCAPSRIKTCWSVGNNSRVICGKFSGEECQTIALDGSQGTLQPICLTNNPKLNRSKRISVFHGERSFVPYVGIEQKRNPTSKNRKEEPNGNAFTVPSVSRFNSFTTDDLTNNFISGIASLLILVHITHLIRGLMYAFPGIRKSRYNTYIIFSRLSRMRYLFRLLSAREEGVLSQIRNRPRKPVERNYRALFIPILAVIVLYTGEIGAIIAGSEVRSKFTSENNFDPRISLETTRSTSTLRPRLEDDVNPNCDDFFVPQRGLQRRGKVLKCVEENSNPMCEPYEHTIQLNVRFGSGRMAFQVHGAGEECAELELSTVVRGIHGIDGRTMPFRPDLMGEVETRDVLNRIMNGVRRRLEYDEIDVKSDVWSFRESNGANDQIVDIEMYHKHEIRKTVNETKTALKAELRSADLVLNSSGAPWTFYAAYDFRQQADMVMATSKRSYVSHGALVIAVVVIYVAHIFLNSLLTYFDEVAYIAMKELIGEDCVLGPLTSNGRAEASVMRYEELMASDDEEVSARREGAEKSGGGYPIAPTLLSEEYNVGRT